MYNKIEARVKEILRSELSEKIKTDINSDSIIYEIGINSISFIKIITLLESEFEIEFVDEDLDYKNFTTIKDICNYVLQRVIEKD